MQKASRLQTKSKVGINQLYGNCADPEISLFSNHLLTMQSKEIIIIETADTEYVQLVSADGNQKFVVFFLTFFMSMNFAFSHCTADF